MKLTDKLAKANFDFNQIFGILDPNGKNKMELDLLFTEISNTLNIFFSIEEQLAIRNCLFPGFRDENVTFSKKRAV